MSKSIAKLVTGVVQTLTLPLSARQRKRVTARVIEGLMQQDLTTIITPRGTLKFNQLRSGFTASAAARFHTDEPETLAWIDGFTPNSTLWDIGSSLGLYSLYAALEPTLRVLAFEPSGFNFGCLIEHIVLNEMGDRVQPFCIALGDTNGIGELFMSYASPGHGGNTLNRAENQFRTFTPAFRQAVLAFSVDHFRETYNLAPPDHIKLDVDGIESEIVRGAIRTLPTISSIMIEVEGRTGADNAAEMESILTAAGLVEDPAIRTQGSCRNRLYRRAASSKS
jgi:FkbM family methyltransferase